MCTEMILKNGEVSCGIGLNGGLDFLGNGRGTRVFGGREYLTFYTDAGVINTLCTPAEIVNTGNGISVKYECDEGIFEITYTLGNSGTYALKKISFCPKRAMTLYRVSETVSAGKGELIDYKTFVYASAAAFLRNGNGGVFCGFTNPYCSTEMSGDEITTSFEPSLYLKAGQPWECDSYFIGLYSKSGTAVSAHIPFTPIEYHGIHRARYRNPCGHIPLDTAEIQAFKKFVDDWFEVEKRIPLFMSYNFFSHLPQRPSSGADETAFIHSIDTFAQMGGDMILFNPLYPNAIPSSDPESRWELAPAGTAAERILKYAGEKCLRTGILMSTAGNAMYGDSILTPYAPSSERPGWKKRRMDGKLSEENCVASKEFSDWYIRVQANTIRHYGLALWNWDPGPGNARFCWDGYHGHIPGKGEYLGFRSALRIMKALKDEFPELYLMSFHGLKEYGLWGYRYIDQHEAYWENEPYIMSPLWPDPSLDRITADGIRQQSWWNQNFRFLPGCMNHGLAHRMAQNCFIGIPADRMTDHFGYKYALISAIASGGNVTLPIFPHDPEKVYGGDYLEFYKKWIGWTRNNAAFFRHITPFGSQVENGCFDGFAGLCGGTGYIAAANPSPVPVNAEFQLGDEIGLEETGASFQLKMLYPDEYLCADAVDLNTVFKYGSVFHTVIPPYRIFLYTLVPADSDKNRLYGLSADVSVSSDGGLLRIEKALGRKGETVDCLYASPDINFVTVNGCPVPFKKAGDKVKMTFTYGDIVYKRHIITWLNGGKAFICPNTEYIGAATLKFDIGPAKYMLELCRESEKLLSEEDRRTITLYTEKTGRRNTVWASPDRVFLIFPIYRGHERIKAALNGRALTLCNEDVKYFGFCEDVLTFGDITEQLDPTGGNTLEVEICDIKPYEFNGALLYYPEGRVTEKINPVNDSSPSYPIRKYPEVNFYPGSSEIKVDAAWIDNGIIRENYDFEVLVKLNLPFESVEGVYASVPISIGNTGDTLKFDMAFYPDAESGLWKLRCRSGERYGLIIDPPSIIIYPVDSKHNTGKPFVLPIEWEIK